MKKGTKIAVCFGLVIFLSIFPIVSIKATTTVPTNSNLCLLTLSLSKNLENRYGRITPTADGIMPAGECSSIVTVYFNAPHVPYMMDGIYRLKVELVPKFQGGDTIYMVIIDRDYEFRNETEGPVNIVNQPYYANVPRGTYKINMYVYATMQTQEWSFLQNKWIWDGISYSDIDEKETLESIRFPMGFPEGSAVKMADGATINIEDVKVGDYVLSYDELNEITVPAEVVNVYESEMRSVNSIIINNELQIPNCHQLYINNMWNISQSAQENDLTLKLSRNNRSINIDISSLSNKTLNDTIFYDLEIDPLDNHINGYWVNNYLVMGRF